MSDIAPRAYRPRLLTDWAKDILAFVLTIIFTWICVGPVLDWILALLGWP